jgi:hypothetical protein
MTRWCSFFAKWTYNHLVSIEWANKKTLCLTRDGWMVCCNFATFFHHFFTNRKKMVNGKHELVGLVRVETPKIFSLGLSMSYSFLPCWTSKAFLRWMIVTRHYYGLVSSTNK